MSLDNKDKRVLEVALANKNTAEKVVDMLESSGGGGGNPEGTAVLSTGEVANLVLTSDGNGASSWQPGGGGGGSPEGTAVLSTGESSGAVLTADGNGASSWTTLPPIPFESSGSNNLTFGAGVGLLNIRYRGVGSTITVEIPSGSTADGGGAVIQSGTGIPPQFRPVADISFPAIVTNNGTKVIGKLVVTTLGLLVFSAGPNSEVFTDNQPAGFDRIAITYTIGA